MSEFDIFMAILTVVCMGFATWIVTLSRKVKMQGYSIDNLIAAVKQLQQVQELLQQEHKDSMVSVEKTFQSLGR